MQRNPTLKQAAAQFEAALSRSVQAGLYPNPTIGYVQDQIGSFSESKPTANGFTVAGKPSPGDNVGGFVQWQIVTAGKLRLSRAKFAEEANAARWQSIYQELRVLNGVRIQFLEVLAAQRLIDIHRELFKLDGESVRTMREMVNLGQANEPELLQARVRERREGVMLRNSENHYRGAWEELVSLVGAPEMRPVPMDPAPLDAEVASIGDFDGTLAHLLHHSPEIQAALSEIRRDQIMVHRERVEPIPNVQVQAVTGYNYEFGVQTAGVQIGFPIPITNRNQGTVREAMSDLTRDHAEYDRIALSLRQRLAEAYTRYQDASESVADFRGGSLPMARRWPTRCSSPAISAPAHTLAHGDRCPADVFRPEPGIRRIAAGAAPGRGRDRRHARRRWAELAQFPDFAGAHRSSRHTAVIPCRTGPVPTRPRATRARRADTMSSRGIHGQFARIGPCGLSSEESPLSRKETHPGVRLEALSLDAPPLPPGRVPERCRIHR